MRLLDMAGLRMHVLPVAIDWNADIQLPVGLSGAGLEVPPRVSMMVR